MLKLAIHALPIPDMKQSLQKWMMRLYGKRLGALCVIMLALVVPASGRAAQTAQDISKPAQVRLLNAGRDSDTGKYRVVIEIALEEGYKTYWHDPGDSGVPTEFSWVNSRDIARIHTRFPVPTRFFDGNGQAIGYLQTVRFPVEVTPAPDGKNPLLRLSASFGVCRELCIPEEAEAETTLSEVEAVVGLWNETVAHLPLKAQPGQKVGGLELQKSRLTDSELSVVVAGEAGKQLDVFAEAVEGWQFGQPRHLVKDGAEHFIFPVIASRTAEEDVGIKLTIKSEKNAIEVLQKLPIEQP